MQYPIATNVMTYLLDTTPDEGSLASPVFTFVRMADGELITREHDDYRDAQSYCFDVESEGATVLAVVEGERNLSTGEASAWIRQ